MLTACTPSVKNKSLLAPHIETQAFHTPFDKKITCLNSLIQTQAPTLIDVQNTQMDFLTESFVDPKPYIISSLSRVSSINIKISSNDNYGEDDGKSIKKINSLYKNRQLKTIGFIDQKESTLGGTGNINIRLPFVGTFMNTMNYRKKTLSVLLNLVDTNDIIQTTSKQYGHHVYEIPLSAKVNVSYVYLSGGMRVETSKIIDEESDSTSYKYNLDFSLEKTAQVINQAVELGINTAIYILLTRYFNLNVSACLEDKLLIEAIITDEKTHGREKAGNSTLKLSNRLKRPR